MFVCQIKYAKEKSDSEFWMDKAVRLAYSGKSLSEAQKLELIENVGKARMYDSARTKDAYDLLFELASKAYKEKNFPDVRQFLYEANKHAVSKDEKDAVKKMMEKMQKETPAKKASFF